MSMQKLDIIFITPSTPKPTPKTGPKPKNSVILRQLQQLNNITLI